MYETIRADLSFNELTKMLPEPRYSEQKSKQIKNKEIADTKIKSEMNLN